MKWHARCDGGGDNAQNTFVEALPTLVEPSGLEHIGPISTTKEADPYEF